MAQKEIRTVVTNWRFSPETGVETDSFVVGKRGVTKMVKKGNGVLISLEDGDEVEVFNINEIVYSPK